PTTTVPYTLSLHDALPISRGERYIITGGEEPLVGTAQRRFVLDEQHPARRTGGRAEGGGSHRSANICDPPRPSTVRSARAAPGVDRKSTRLNSSHRTISYA